MPTPDKTPESIKIDERNHVEKPLLQYQYQLRGRASFEACTAKAHLKGTSTWVIRPVPSSLSSQVGSDGRKAGTDATALSPSLSFANLVEPGILPPSSEEDTPCSHDLLSVVYPDVRLPEKCFLVIRTPRP